MAPKRDGWSRTRTLKEGGVEANLSINVRGCPPSSLSTFDALFQECMERLNLVLETTKAAAEGKEAELASEARASSHTPSAQAVAEHGASSDAADPLRVNAAAADGSAGGADPQIAPKHGHGELSDGDEQRADAAPEHNAQGIVNAEGRRRRGGALLLKKCELSDCRKRPYSRAFLEDVQRLFPDATSTSNTLELCRPHFRKVQRRKRSLCKMRESCVARLSIGHQFLAPPIFCVPICHQIFGTSKLFTPRFVTTFSPLQFLHPNLSPNFRPSSFCTPVCHQICAPPGFAPQFVTKFLPLECLYPILSPNLCF